MAKTVKARYQHGADSFNLTIPAETSREFSVDSDDVFEVETSEDEDGNMVIKYKRVYSGDN